MPKDKPANLLDLDKEGLTSQDLLDLDNLMFLKT